MDGATGNGGGSGRTPPVPLHLPLTVQREVDPFGGEGQVGHPGAGGILDGGGEGGGGGDDGRLADPLHAVGAVLARHFHVDVLGHRQVHRRREAVVGEVRV